MTSKKFEEIKETLLQWAKNKFPNDEIVPAGNETTLDDCYTIDTIKGGYLVIFWYNIGKYTYVERLKYYLKFNESEGMRWKKQKN